MIMKLIQKKLFYGCKVQKQIEELHSFLAPEKYNEIPDFIWMDVIKNVIKKLEKMEDELKNYNMNEFSISGHTEGKRYLPWQMFDKSRYVRSNHE